MKYDVVIGLEVHCELSTVSKNFSGAPNAYSDEANSNIAEVDLGLPGILPVVNKEAVKKALKMALALNCETPDELIFDRKNYYYPDLPKGYQITQITKPVGVNGSVMINVNGQAQKVLIHDTHLEEDTASLDHYDDYSLIDYNRSGIPLLETVTEPCLSNADEAVTFLETLRSIFLYCDTSEADSKKGQMRCDVNISLKPKGSELLGTKVEMKNINSFNNVRLAIEYEIKRQTKALENDEEIIQETRRFSDVDNKTYPMRTKVDAVDYKYYLEPNIVPIRVTNDWLEEIQSEIPMLQYERINKYITEYGLSRYDSTIIVKEKAIADYYETLVSLGIDAKEGANWIITILLGYLNKHGLIIENIYVTAKMLAELIELAKDGKVSRNQAKDILYRAIEEKSEPLKIINESNISQITDDEAIRTVVQEVISENSAQIIEYQAGKDKVLDYLVGQVMKKTKGKANPPIVSKLMLEEIGK